jgi:hypothetical protein
MEVEAMNESSPPAGDSAAPFLFLDKDMTVEKVGAPAFTGVSTGERLIRDRPDVYQSIVYLLSQGTGIREIKRITGVHHRTIEAVMVREGQTIDTARKELGARALRVAAMGVERLEEIIADGNIKPGELSMAVGILTDKAQLLTGGVTSRVEKIESAQVAAGLEAMLEALPVADAELIEDASEINPVSQNLDSIALPVEDPAASSPVDPDAWITESVVASTDEQSGVSVALDSVEAETATDLATEPAPKSPRKSSRKAPAAGRSKEGGRGSGSKPRAKNRD